MIFSDFYPRTARDFKIEVLPSDYVDKHADVLTKGDMLVTVYRPIVGNFLVDRLKHSLIPEFKSAYRFEKCSFEEALNKAIIACITVYGIPLADQNMITDDAMALVVYISSDGNYTIARRGAITLKKRNGDRFTVLS